MNISTDHLLGLNPVREPMSPTAVGMPRVTLNLQKGPQASRIVFIKAPTHLLIHLFLYPLIHAPFSQFLHTHPLKSTVWVRRGKLRMV